MNDINDILLDGEQVLWSGAPDWASEKAPSWLLTRLLGFALFRSHRSEYRFRDIQYAVTTQRLLVLRDQDELVSADWSKLQAYDVRRVRKTCDVTLSFETNTPDCLMITLYALSSMKELEAIIFKTHPNGVQP